MKSSLSHVSESPTRENDSSPRAWLEVRKDALEWIAADRPEWRHDKGPIGAINVERVSADTGLPRMTAYRLRDLQGVHGPAKFKADSIAQIVSIGASERRVADSTAFDNIFVVKCTAPVGVAA
jgi:hypothetical protein